MNLSRMCLLNLAILGVCVSMAAAANVTTSTFDGGGAHATSANYSLDGSIGGIDGVASAGAAAAKNGYIGQLTEVVSVSATGTPAVINQGATSQLSGSATLDDQSVTALAGADFVWSPVSYPFYSVTSNGLLTAVANVYAAPSGSVNGAYLGVPANTSVQVLGPYASSTIPDSWFSQYFGAAPNPLAAPAIDADGTGQNNLFKYVAELNPTNPASIFTLQIATVGGAANQKNLIYNPIASGRTYTPQFTTNLVAVSYVNLTSVSAPQTNGNQVTVTDLSATGPGKFYHINISFP